jgi:hypothetical protein
MLGANQCRPLPSSIELGLEGIKGFRSRAGRRQGGETATAPFALPGINEGNPRLTEGAILT